MGVIRNNVATATPERVDDFFVDHINDYVFDDSPSEAETEPEQQPAAVVVRRPRRNRKPPLDTPRAVDIDAHIRRRGGKIGARKQRRLENARLLSAYADANDICDDLTDTLPSGDSPFTRLFLDEGAMKRWREFIERPEEEQAALLRRSKQQQHHGERGLDDAAEQPGTSTSPPVGEQLGGRGVQSPQHRPTEAKDRLSAGFNRTFTGESCFNRMDSKIRNLLMRNAVPWSYVDNVEETLVDYFTASPRGQYETSTQAAGRFERLLIHAVAQYLSLRSNTYGGPSGERRTRVHNMRPYFVSPYERLSEFVARRRGNGRSRAHSHHCPNGVVETNQ